MRVVRALFIGTLGCAWVQPSVAACPESDAGLTLAPGFCATVFADEIGHARHLVVAPNGVVYVNTWSGRYYGNDRPHDGGFVVALSDSKGSGHADRIERFGATAANGAAGGTGIAIYRDGLFVEQNDKILRYALPPTGLAPREKPTTVVAGLPLGGDHPMHPFAIDADGMLYVDLGSATNSCQRHNRVRESPGVEPCKELETRGGIWRYDANKVDQPFSRAERWATGIRNAVGIAVDAKTNAVFATQHGRDQLRENWSDLYTPEEGAKWPAEELLAIEQGGDYGWPECYFDPDQRELVLAPEYGGDGGQKVGACAEKLAPVAAFPAHWAPNALLMYDAKAGGTGAWPDRYRDGAFIAFHGSWNRAPFAQGGYNVVYQSLASPDASRCEIFADGFAGANVSPGGAAHRPSGLALAPDGALYVSDDRHGRIYRITYVGGTDANAIATPCPPANAAPVAVGAPAPVAAAGDSLAQGKALYQQSGCTGCHGDDGRGTPLGPDLTDAEWLWSDGSTAGIAKTIRSGVAKPKQFREPMPALGGATLSDQQVASLAQFVASLGRSAARGSDAAQIAIPGERVFPESLTSTSDGAIFIGSIALHGIFRVAPGAQTAAPWATVDADGPQAVFGVFADDAGKRIWACADSLGQGPQAELVAIDVATARTIARYRLPTPNAFCNDIAVDAAGAVYATDTANMEIVRLARGASSLVVWAGNGAFGAQGDVLDGVAVIGASVYVNTLRTNKLFRVWIAKDGKAGAIAELALSRPIDAPDGMRSDAGGLLLVESGGAGRLSRVVLGGEHATVTTLGEGFPDGPVAVTRVGANAWVLEAQLKAMSPTAQLPIHPFRATAVPIH